MNRTKFHKHQLKSYRFSAIYPCSRVATEVWDVLALSRKTDYALIALAHLALHRQRVASAREIAVQYHVPLPVLMNLLKRLTHNGLVISVRGARGGYQLAREPATISLRALIEIVDGPFQFALCAGNGASGHSSGRSCGIESWCRIKSPIRRIHERLNSVLDQVTLADIIQDPPGGHELVACSTKELIA